MLRKVENVFRIIGLIFMPLGALFVVICLVLACIAAAASGLSADGALALHILTFVFLGIGVIFAAIGVIFYMMWRRKEVKAARLKRDGACYDAVVIGEAPSLYTRINGYPTFYVECWYKDEQEKTCLVKSGAFLMNPLFFGKVKDGLKAKVYVSRDDPKDYYVEIVTNPDTEMTFDNDYR